MSETVIPGIPKDISLLAGPMLLGGFFNWGLYGILCLQTYIYYLSFPNDSRNFKIVVYFLFICDTIQTIMSTHNAWYFLSSGWGDTYVLTHPGWSWIAVPLFTGIVSAVVQLFFGWRIWKLSGSYILSGVVVVLALIQSTAAIVSGVWFELLEDTTKVGVLRPPAIVWLAGSAIVDVIITASLVTYLARSSTGFTDTDDIIAKLIRMTVETGACTTTAAILELVLFLVYQTTNLYMIPALPLAKLYTNTLLASLNSRSQTFNSSSQRSQFQSHDNSNVTTKHLRKLSRNQVHVTTVREVVEDVAMIDLPKGRQVESIQVSYTNKHQSADQASFEDDDKSYGLPDSKLHRSDDDLESGRQ
ncbi:hypothetical protein FRC03_011812 [Tulasnella sp. 419]|nr:hypothetical protein FRC02_008093 [Tulasnella sp. 418]KAG8970013.1 hypothetical protein FRC03_011812 [Tulasnella sp. 419]